jgi:hypothetical protein
MIGLNCWPGKVPVLANTFGKCWGGTEHELSIEILQQMVRTTKSGDNMSYEDLTECSVDIVEESSLVDLWA